MNNKKLKKALKARLNTCNDIEKYVIGDILEQDNPIQYIKDVLSHGCISGMVSGLIYYNDTQKFYIDYIDDIEELKEEMEDNLGEPLKIGTPVYNWLAWFGYEETMRKIADRLNIEL